MAGWRLPRPESCLGEIYRLMLDAWIPDASVRPKAQTIMRDINQILYNGSPPFLYLYFIAI